jgi:hypothetical protein
MEDSHFSDEFCRFVQTTVVAVDAAELLLLLCSRPDPWTLDEAIDALRPHPVLSAAQAKRYIDLFQARGVVVVGADKRVEYRPVSEAVAEHVRTLSQAYRQRPVTMIRLIYALRDAKIQSFADAFKLKRE